MSRTAWNWQQIADARLEDYKINFPLRKTIEVEKKRTKEKKKMKKKKRNRESI